MTVIKHRRIKKRGGRAFQDERQETFVVEESLLDVWLQRASYIAQFGLFLFTVGTVYFTVIPLYQKALLEESIAKKEIELKNTTDSLEKVYVKLRAAIVKQFVLIAGAECSGLMETPPPPLLDELAKHNVISKDETSQSSPSHSRQLFDIDVAACLSKTANQSGSLQDLRTEDRKLLNQKLTIIGKELMPIRQRAVDEYKKASAGSKDEKAFWMRLRIENDYGEAIRSKILTINKIEWGETNSQ
jgi:hypothetical protein